MSELPELEMYQDAYIEEMKDHYARMFSQGRPLIVHPFISEKAKRLGFEEGVHFIVSQPLPLA